MKIAMKVMAGVVLLVTLGVGSSHAQHTYHNNALKGCYGFLSNSVDVANPTSTVGTICFDGAGKIIPNVGVLDQTGWSQTTNGVNGNAVHVAGAYAVTNVPGQGMGSIKFANGCSYNFSINSVDATGLAHGFQFSLYSSANCEDVIGDPTTVGGTAYLQP